MKKSTLVILILLYSALSFAEIKPFQLRGKIVGPKDFRYAYVFDNKYKLIFKEKIDNKSLVFSGRYNAQQRFGVLGMGMYNQFNAVIDDVSYMGYSDR